MLTGELLHRGNLSGGVTTVSGISSNYRILKAIISARVTGVQYHTVRLSNTDGSFAVLHLYGNDSQLTTTGQSQILASPNANVYNYGAYSIITINEANVAKVGTYPDTKTVRVEHYNAVNGTQGFGTQKINNSSGNFDTISQMQFYVDYGSGSWATGATVELWGYE